MEQHIFIRLSILIFLLNSSLFASISGQVLQDLPVRNTGSTLELNTYGVQDSNELGIANIKVTAYPDNISTLTDSNGTWTLATTQDSRIEFSEIPSYLKESPSQNTDQTSIQFISDGTSDVTFHLHNPSDFSDTTNPTYVLNIQENGTHVGSTMDGLHFIDYDSTGLNSDYSDYESNSGTGPQPTDSITVSLVGSVWGKAYQKNKNRLFAASMLQRHVGYANDSSSIYVVDYSNNSTDDSKISNFSLQGKTPSNGGSAIDLGTIDRSDLQDDPSTQNVDVNAYANVGKMSYGGIDIDYTTNTLWMINLNQQAIISHDVSTDDVQNAETNQYLLAGKTNLPVCTGGELRPWALQIHEGRGYIGAVCNALTSKSEDDLSAHVFSFDLSNPSNGFQNELDFDLNYTKKLEAWHPWEDTYVTLAQRDQNENIYEQPILSDIEFDENNNMYLAFMDRYASQVGTNNYAITNDNTNEKAYAFGDILKVCNTQNSYEVEGTGSCTQSNYTSTDGTVNEFFNDLDGSGAAESSLGSLALIKGSSQLLHTVVDPHPENDSRSQQYWTTQGAVTLSLTDGSIINWYSNVMTDGVELNGKANGIGDVELITAAAPLEVGNRIWFDANADGVQNANEAGIAGVEINLVCNGTTVSTATTNANGNYVFSNDSSTNLTSTASHQYGIASLLENQSNCSLSIPNATGASKQSNLQDYVLTLKNAGEGTNALLNDSNAESNNSSAQVTINALDIPISGANNHSFDIGFKPANTYTLGDRVWLDSNEDGIQDSNESGVENVTVTLYNSADCASNEVSSLTTDANGNYNFTNLAAGTYCVAFTNIPTNYIISPNTGSNDTSNSDANVNGQIQNIVLTADNPDEDMGIYPPAIVPPVVTTYTLGDRVWLDSNEDGIQDSNESGVENVTVTLYTSADCTSNEASSITTDANGNYNFTNLAAGTYCLAFTDLPTDYIISPSTGSNDTSNSDADANAQIQNIVLTADNPDEDMGIYASSTVVPPVVGTSNLSLGNRVWLDANSDGIQDNNETGIDDVNVSLYTNSNCTGEASQSMLTSDGGFYQFDNLEAGEYCLSFTDLPEDHNLTSQNVGSDTAIDSDTNADGFITGINLSNKDLTFDTGITTNNTAVLATHTDGTCDCHPYEEKSVGLFGNLFIPFVLFLLTSFYTFFTLRKEIA